MYSKLILLATFFANELYRELFKAKSVRYHFEILAELKLASSQLNLYNQEMSSVARLLRSNLMCFAGMGQRMHF